MVRKKRKPLSSTHKRKISLALKRGAGLTAVGGLALTGLKLKRENDKLKQQLKSEHESKLKSEFDQLHKEVRKAKDYSDLSRDLNRQAFDSIMQSGPNINIDTLDSRSQRAQAKANSVIDGLVPGGRSKRKQVARQNRVMSGMGKNYGVMDSWDSFSSYVPLPGLIEFEQGDSPKRGDTKTVNGTRKVYWDGEWWTPNQPKPNDTGSRHKKVVLASKGGGDYKKVRYGHKSYDNYGNGHKSEKRRSNYLKRSGGIRNKSGELTKNDKFSPNYWARKDLW